MLSKSLIDDLINPGNTNIIPGLDRMHKILHLLNNPQNTYKVIHITGTNGKGSTAAFLESGLVHAKYNVGKFTSPHIHEINESISYNMNNISDDELELVYVKIKMLLVQNSFMLSPFEFLTTIMFEYFATKNIDFLVLEVGMGGQNDSTNVVDSMYSIITNVSLEHTRWLGNTVLEIAREKSGIIKNGQTIIATDDSDVINAVKDKTHEYINVLDYHPQIDLDIKNFRTKISTKEFNYNLSLFGKFQVPNFLCAYTVFKGLNLPEASIKYSAENTIWPGRLQLVQRDPLVMLDATHNAHGAKSLVQTMTGIFKPDEVIIITSILVDKDIKNILTCFSQIASSIIYTGIDNNPRGMKAENLSELGEGIFKFSQFTNEPLQALEAAKKLGKRLILISGSLYLLSYFNTK